MTAVPAAGTFQLDKSSTVAIAHKTMWGLVNVKGVFGTVEGSGEVKPDGTATGVLTLHAASLDTKHAKRDAHLRSKDFFLAEQFPHIRFEAVSAGPAEQGTVRIDGRLTIRDVTRPLALTAQVADADADSATLTTQFTVDRTEFGLSWNQLGMMRGPATVTATLRFTRVPA
jgi:polyisoprenoid-binding protein YceI